LFKHRTTHTFYTEHIILNKELQLKQHDTTKYRK
jgi:hypothetical protein